MHSRRDVLTTIPGVALSHSFLEPRHAGRTHIKAVAFDGFAIFDAAPVFSLLDDLFPAQGKPLANLWRARQFEYMWLRSLSRRYSSFLSITAEALVFAAKALGVELTAVNRSRLLDAWMNLPCWPDALESLGVLRSRGLRIAFLSNMSEGMLQAGVRQCGLAGYFDLLLSTDVVRSFKPDPRAYQMAVDGFSLRREEIAFVAFAGWDAAGAKSFGYPTFWVNRQNQPAEELGGGDIVGEASVSDVVGYLSRE